MHDGNWHDAACDLRLRDGPRHRLRIGLSAIERVPLKMIVRLQRLQEMSADTADTAAYRFFTRAGVKCDELPLWEGFHAR